jgi:putative NADH-flavin reductase
LHGVTYVPVVSSIGEIQEILSADDLTTARPSEQPAAQREREKRVLVVGGAGYLGSILTRKLLARGYRVRVLDSFIYGRKSVEDLVANDRCDIVEGDLRNIHTCVSALEGVNAVILLAAVVGDRVQSAAHGDDRDECSAAQALARCQPSISAVCYASPQRTASARIC